jgi:hypothetical protein
MVPSDGDGFSVLLTAVDGPSLSSTTLHCFPFHCLDASLSLTGFNFTRFTNLPVLLFRKIKHLTAGARLSKVFHSSSFIIILHFIQIFPSLCIQQTSTTIQLTHFSRHLTFNTRYISGTRLTLNAYFTFNE